MNIKLSEMYADLDNDSLDAVVERAIGGNRKLGAESIRAKLFAQGYRVQRDKVRQSVERIDPVGVALRALQTQLQKSVHSVPAPLSRIHIDGNHKLIR